MHVNLLWKSNAGSELRSCALYCAFENFGNTGENIKRMQGTRESPKISVIEITSNTNPATASLALCLSTHPYYEYGGDDSTIAGGACGSGCGCGPASPRRPERSLGTDYPGPESAVSVPAAHRGAARRGGRPVPANMVESGREDSFL